MDEVRETNQAGAGEPAGEEALLAELEELLSRLQAVAVPSQQRLGTLTRLLAAGDRLAATAVGLVAETAAEPATAAAEGFGVAGFLRVFAGRTGGDAAMWCASNEPRVIQPPHPPGQPRRADPAG